MIEKYPLSYTPSDLPRELKRHYISADATDTAHMLEAIGLPSLEALYGHIPEAIRFSEQPDLPEELSYEALQERMVALSEKNRAAVSFIGDGLPAYSQHSIVDFVCGIRNLLTAYTPYQPERSQGTLYTHWVYQSLMAQLTGFEAINSSLYDRATALFEAACAGIRLKRKSDTVILPQGLYPGDLEVVDTLAADTEVNIVICPTDPQTGCVDAAQLKVLAAELGEKLAAIAIPQVNHFGLLEDVDALTDLVHELGVYAIGVIDPMLLCTGGLKAPTEWGRTGADMIVGEAQHLALAPNFGGPGLGLFGIRHNDKCKNDIRQTPGRYVGKANDLNGRECRVMVLSTREQHIRKDKATSNICSNQAFIATLAGASLLARGESGTKAMLSKARSNAVEAYERLTAIPGIEAAWKGAFYNEFTLQLPSCAREFLEKARAAGVHAGISVGHRLEGRSKLLKVSFSDLQSAEDVAQLVSLFEDAFGKAKGKGSAPDAGAYLSTEPLGLPEFSLEEVKSWYVELGKLNCSPDDAPYPLGSCTMKYNPYINEWAAGLPGFTAAHPQAPVEDVQGSLEVLYEIQEWFKKITGLAGVTTQPLAGAQGELVGLKLFQGYFRDRGETQRDVILIPASAHGTNFATAAMAGFTQKTVDGKKVGIVTLKADARGQIDLSDLDEKIGEYGNRIAGVMITNPNTSGLFETDFRQIADKIHAIGGLMYMDGANMNAIAGWLDLGKMGVDAIHNNLHKTWSIPHGGGGPGDAIVAVSEKLVDFLPGYQVILETGVFKPVKAAKSIGSFHRHWGNFQHKLRTLCYLYRLGKEGVPHMSAMATLSARYLFARLSGKGHYLSLPFGAETTPRMHEFILTLSEEDFARAEAAGTPKASVLARVGKLFLDFGFHAPTMSWPEVYGMMIEPTESYTQAELDRFADAVLHILKLVREYPEVLGQTPFFTPVDRIDDVAANRNLCLHEQIKTLPKLEGNRSDPIEQGKLPVSEIYAQIVEQLKQ
ncbi:MAG: aminomethyl-transferring glycine dehydrogenase subunit GcvPB [Opitutales bacterium]|nr:aminomethyl-transferring glycine dehydrogenase subunit GcvPB [Opitutales bacterium]